MYSFNSCYFVGFVCVFVRCVARVLLGTFRYCKAADLIISNIVIIFCHIRLLQHLILCSENSAKSVTNSVFE